MSEKNKSIGLNELVDYKPKVYSSFMDKIMKFLWKCAGADSQILKYAPYSDHIKNAGIGGVVLATAVMASLAMGFAMHSIFGGDIDGEHEGNWFITIPVAIVWGLIIFNLDRFIVSTVKGDGTEKITPTEWKSMLPRLVMAVLIGLCISAPLETYIFKKEIQREWGLSMDQLALSKTYEIMQREHNNDKNNDSAYIIKKREFDDQLKTYQKAVDEVNKEMNGESGRGGDGPETRKKEKQKQIEEERLNMLSAELKILENKKINNKDSIKLIQNKEVEKYTSQEPGFLDQIMMLERLSSNGKTIPKIDPSTNEPIKGEEIEIYPSAFWPIWLVRLLFMIVEIAPVIFKFMIWRSSYDYMQDNVAQILEAKQGISLEYIIDENNNMHKVKENYNARRIVEVSKRQNELEKENAIHAITLYAEKEREEMEKNPEKFILSQAEQNSSSKTQHDLKEGDEDLNT